MTPDTTTLKLITMTYEGDELVMWLRAWEIEPTFTKDCRIDRQRKEFKRKQIVERLQKQKPANL